MNNHYDYIKKLLADESQRDYNIRLNDLHTILATISRRQVIWFKITMNKVYDQVSGLSQHTMQSHLMWDLMEQDGKGGQEANLQQQSNNMVKKYKMPIESILNKLIHKYGNKRERERERDLFKNRLIQKDYSYIFQGTFVSP